MSEQYKITAVSTQTRDYVVNGKANVVYYVKLEGAEPKPGVQAFELHQRQTSKAPAEGQTLDVKTFQEGTFEGKPYVKIIKDWDAIKASQGGGGGGGSDERGESIERQVAAKVAGEMAIGTPDPGGMGAVLVVANFEAYFDAVLAKIKGVPQQLSLNGGEVPADTRDLAPASAPAGAAPDPDDIPFRSLPVPCFETRSRF